MAPSNSEIYDLLNEKNKNADEDKNGPTAYRMCTSSRFIKQINNEH
jgi:hypothetical protein